AAAFIISLAGVASRILGLFRDRILASTFGAGDVLDAYYAAFRVPDLIYNLLILGALSAAFIPVFTQLISKDREEEAWDLASGVLNIQIIAMGIMVIILAFCAPWIMKIITPGFSDEKMNLTVIFTRIMFLSPILLGISGIFGGVLVSMKKFLIYALAPIMYNLGIIFGAIFLVDFMGPIGLAWGVVLGASLHMLIQYPAVRFSGFRFRLMPGKSLKNQDVLKVLHLMVPRMLGVAVNQINFLVITIFASTLATGSLAIFNFANNIQSTPLGLFGISFAIAVFPALSAFYAKNEKEKFSKAFSKTFRQVLFFVIPISVLIYALRAQIVRVVLGAGNFDWEDTTLTFQTLGILIASLFAQSLIPLLARSFYAIQNTKTPFYVALFSEMVNIVLVFLLIGKFEILGLAIAFSVSSIVNMSLLFYFLKKEMEDLGEKEIIKSAGKVLVASFGAVVAVQIGKNVVGSKGELDTFVAILNQLVVAGGLGVAVFSLISYALGIEEFFSVMRSVSRKLFKVKKQIQEDTGDVAGM
ncbi:MAG TPA: murein biosynthesis integral membrane protein MurJ, partial [Candidatus Moranbacteria bacterium]|nr:murein biosynthesis integral membrane protein MurJ [Candidatus Moranbacteria bacterium]